MKIFQKEISLTPQRRGFNLITQEIVKKIPEISEIEAGIATIFIKHTSASLTINENADPDVRIDLETLFNRNFPERLPEYRHTFEGSDDMPAHAKATAIGQSLTIPITNGRLNMGTWQGIYLCEHRNHAHSRQIVVTILGQ
ncbi:MAG: YjbQ family protein [Spirochaetales bacterium]|nr:YjbQ family protein [Spirochaetales bacterium]